MNQRKLLFVSYHFPPIASAAVARVTGLIKYLRRRGWDITVITVPGSRHLRNDPAMLDRIADGVRVIRTPYFEFMRRPRHAPGTAPASAETHSRPGAPRSTTTRIIELLKAPLRRVLKLLNFPDRHITWFFPLLFHASRVIRRDDYRLVLSSSPPHSIHLPLVLLRSMLRFQWVTDFRDCWTAPSYLIDRKSLRRRAKRLLERIILGRCDAVVCNTRGNRDELLRTFSFLPEEKLSVVSNAYDHEFTVRDCEVAPEEIDCDMMYLGDLYPQAMALLVSALLSIRERHEGRLPTVFVYGKIEESDLRRLRQQQLHTHVVFKGTVSWDKSIHLMRKAPALLLLLPHTKGGATTVPSKLFSYLFAGRPILTLGPEGDAAAIVRSSGAGVAITAEDPDRIGDELLSFVDANRGGVFNADTPPDTSAYTMEARAAELDALLTGLLGTDTSP